MCEEEATGEVAAEPALVLVLFILPLLLLVVEFASLLEPIETAEIGPASVVNREEGKAEEEVGVPPEDKLGEADRKILAVASSCWRLL